MLVEVTDSVGEVKTYVHRFMGMTPMGILYLRIQHDLCMPTQPYKYVPGTALFTCNQMHWVSLVLGVSVITLPMYTLPIQTM